MGLNRYQFRTSENLRTFEFVSEGPKGNITKEIQFQLTGVANIYNLAFGDKDPETGEIDDKVVTDNGDPEKVLSTVAAVMYVFAKQFPEAWIYATGSTPARTRLYRMGINKYFDIASADFDILGDKNDYWEPYKHGENYYGFIVHLKTSKFGL